MAMTLTRILGVDGPSLVIRIDIHQIKTSQNYSPDPSLLICRMEITISFSQSCWGDNKGRWAMRVLCMLQAKQGTADYHGPHLAHYLFL